jgi:glyoxylase-like metal-dependent hydrolase (beta-lactamase superfamily II)
MRHKPKTVVITRVGAFVAVIGFAGSLHAQTAPAWIEPFPPFHIAGNLYYVGSKGLANYLITTSRGHILINSDLDANVPLIRASVEKLGFKFSDIKILLIGHAHWDRNADECPPARRFSFQACARSLGRSRHRRDAGDRRAQCRDQSPVSTHLRARDRRARYRAAKRAQARTRTET